jgi:hypothetical protein
MGPRPNSSCTWQGRNGRDRWRRKCVAAVLNAALTAHLARRPGVVEQPPSEERERIVYRGEAHPIATCGLQYVYATDGL